VYAALRFLLFAVDSLFCFDLLRFYLTWEECFPRHRVLKKTKNSTTYTENTSEISSCSSASTFQAFKLLNTHVQGYISLRVALVVFQEISGSFKRFQAGSNLQAGDFVVLAGNNLHPTSFVPQVSSSLDENIRIPSQQH